MSSPALSIVVIGRNEGRNLAHCLGSIALLRGIDGAVQVIYVDSASSDGSPRIAADLGAEVVVLQGGRPTAARGRNAGWQRAVAESVLFLDGDTIVDPGFARRAIDALAADPGVAAVWGHRRELRPERSIYNRVLDLDWIYAPGETAYCGGDVVIRKAALAEAGGYDAEMIAGEEPELCRRMRACGYRILHIDAPMTLHDLNITRFSQYWKHAQRAGHAYAEVSSRFRGSPDPMWARESADNLRRGGFWIVALIAAPCLLAWNGLAALCWMAFLLALCGRSAWKARWKAPGRPGLLLLYGIHSQLQQVPILAGQLQYYFDRMTGRRRGLIEYKRDTIHGVD